MKGIVFNLLEQVVVQRHGEAVWDDLLDATGLSGSYTSLGSYPDDEIEKLVAAGADALGKTPAEVLRWFGREAMPLLAKHYPKFFTGHANTRSFVLSVNSIIHPEVHKLYNGARCPVFRFEETAEGRLLLGYDSPRRLCALAQGFIEGAGDHFGETMEVEHLSCMLKGDPKCLLGIRTASSSAAMGNEAA
jgi:predicted hydrocarbon binding protein